MKEIKLFDYQEDMKERIEKALRLHRSVMAQMPTGTGKTVLLASVVESFLREHSNCNVWIVAHRRELVSQIRETIQRVFSKTPSLLYKDFSNHPVNSSKITPSLFTLKEGSTSHPDPLTLRGEGGNRPTRCSEPLRSKVGGPSKVSPDCAGWDRLGATCLRPADGLAATCLRSADGLAATCLRPTEGLGDRLGERGGDGLGATSASSVNPTSDMMPIKAVSIQWLSKHYDEIEEEPGMIVIDEAHHALAKTYKEMWERFPNAKFLGLTATPCRLNGKGFTDLFDVLVQSWSVPEFISKGRLATYDFVSIKSDSVAQRLIDSLQKRGADGDYQNKEMDMLLNKKPSIERLYRSLEEYGKDRKGIVYAINISHANAIAEFYREHGIVAVAIDSKTPSSLRKELIERFKASSNTSQNLPFSNHPVNSSKITPSLFTIKEGSTAFPKPLSPHGTGDVPTALLGAQTATLYGWRTIRGLRQQQSCILRYATAWTRIAYRLLARCLMLAECSLDARCWLAARCLMLACGGWECCQGLFGEFLGQHVLEEEGIAEDVTTPHAAGLFQETVEPFETVVLPP